MPGGDEARKRELPRRILMAVHLIELVELLAQVGVASVQWEAARNEHKTGATCVEALVARRYNLITVVGDADVADLLYYGRAGHELAIVTEFSYSVHNDDQEEKYADVLGASGRELP